MYTVMVTGGIGSGKSTLVGAICAKGATSIDLDEVNRNLLASNSMLIADLAARFGEDILDEDGSVVPARLAERAFKDRRSTQDLNSISFPYITEAATDRILDVDCVPLTDARVLVVEVPLLTEVPEFAKLADEVIAVVAPTDLRLARAVARGMDALDVMRRMEVQASDAQRIEIADVVYENIGSLDDMCSWVDAWFAQRSSAIEGQE